LAASVKKLVRTARRQNIFDKKTNRKILLKKYIHTLIEDSTE
jgi:hypothetical protein